MNKLIPKWLAFLRIKYKFNQSDKDIKIAVEFINSVPENGSVSKNFFYGDIDSGHAIVALIDANIKPPDTENDTDN